MHTRELYWSGNIVLDHVIFYISLSFPINQLYALDPYSWNVLITVKLLIHYLLYIQ